MLTLISKSFNYFIHSAQISKCKIYSIERDQVILKNYSIESDKVESRGKKKQIYAETRAITCKGTLETECGYF
ncbi:hypothetical protein MAR_036239 [Mya arenaria]|uniref:Uncharacterized protein n=1 Tax=Mya arenaria TaxID=6604 RepID=A0ABY7EMF5_MYAAR|nr:hypothetical protein MAR_036239 [Mya arenaria]